MNELVKRIVHKLAVAYVRGTPGRLVNLLKSRRFSYLWEHCNDEKYFICTEDWLFSLLCELRESRKDLFSSEQSESERLELENLLLMVDTFVCRTSSNFITLTKRTNLYEELVMRLATALASSFDPSSQVVVEGVLSAYATQGNRIFSETKAKHGIDVFILETKPKTVFNRFNEVDAMLVCKDGVLARVTDFSPYLASLKKCVAEDQQFHIVLFGKDIKKELGGNPALIEEIKCDSDSAPVWLTL